MKSTPESRRFNRKAAFRLSLSSLAMSSVALDFRQRAIALSSSGLSRSLPLSTSLNSPSSLAFPPLRKVPFAALPRVSTRNPREIQNYLNRISGPLLDRIDIQVEVPAVKFHEITAERTGETSAQIRERVVTAPRRQQERFAGKRNLTCNARMGSCG